MNISREKKTEQRSLKKRIFSVAVVLGAALILGACGMLLDEPMERTLFEEVMRENNLAIIDATELWDDDGSHGIDIALEAEEERFSIILVEYNSIEYARADFRSLRAGIDEVVEGAQFGTTTVDVGNRNLYSLTSGGIYYYLLRVDDSILYIRALTEHRDEVSEIMSQLGIERGGGFDFASLVPIILIIFVIAMVPGLVVIISLWKIFKKAGKRGWESIVPFYDSYTMYDITWGNGWYFLLEFVPGMGWIIWILTCLKLAKSFGKDTGFGVGLIFLYVIFLPILAFGDAKYIGPEGVPKGEEMDLPLHYPPMDQPPMNQPVMNQPIGEESDNI